MTRRWPMWLHRLPTSRSSNSLITLRVRAESADCRREMSVCLTHRPMSALGQKQTFAPQKLMSALPPKADMCGATGDVRFGPKADITNLFDHLVGAILHRLRDGNAERLRGLEVEEQL